MPVRHSQARFAQTRSPEPKPREKCKFHMKASPASWVVVKIRVPPFWALNIVRHLLFRAPQKGPYFFFFFHMHENLKLKP